MVVSLSGKTLEVEDSPGMVWKKNINTNDRALFAMFARSNLDYQEPGNGDTKLSGKGRGEDTCHMSLVIQVRRKA